MTTHSQLQQAPWTKHAWNVRVIGVPTDFQAPASGALEFALLLARQFGASLKLLHVVNPPILVPPQGMTPAEAPTHASMPLPSQPLLEPRQQLEPRLDALVERCNEAAVSTTGEVVVHTASTHRAIVEAALQSGADLIVMGTHGRSGLGRALKGSVTEGVMRHARVPVLAVPIPHE